MNQKNLFIFFLLLFMVVNPIEAMSTNWTQRGNYSISWYNKSERSFVISNSAELAGVAYLVNNGYTTFKDVTITLSDDISLSGHQWMAIGSSMASCFQGTFDGNNHKVIGVRMTESSFDDCKYMGFFACLKGASIKNLNILFSEFTITNILCSESSVGKVVGYAENSKIENVSADGALYWKKGKISFSGYYSQYVGGLIGQISKCTISNCKNLSQGLIHIEMGALSDKDYYTSLSLIIGGIVGHADNSVNRISTIYGCENRGDIDVKTGGSYNGLPSIEIGGIAGYFIDSTRIESCYNNASYFSCKNTSNKIISAGIGGISACDFNSAYSDGRILNCYSSTTDITYGVWLHTKAKLKYGGITASYTKGTNNLYSSIFSPSNMEVTPYNVYKESIPLQIGFNGDDYYSSQQMKSQEFLDMLNEYSIIQEGKCIWENRKIGVEFPSLIQEDISNVKNIMADNIRPYYKIENNELTIHSKGKLMIYNINGEVVFTRLSYQGEPIKLELPGMYIISCNNYCFKAIVR